MPRLSACLLLILALLPRPAGAGALEADMAALLAQEGLTGAVWALVTPDGVTTGAAGTRDAGTRAPMLAHDRVQVGSVTKTMLAAAVLRLVTEGRLALDTPVAELLPDIAIPNRWERDHPLRLRHLLDHTSGLDDARLWHFMSLRAPADGPLADAVRGDADLLRLRVPPGSRFSYSNLGYHLLGMVVERITGERYEGWADGALLRPLGMADSSFAFITQSADPRLAMGHLEGGAPAPTLPTWLRPAAQFTTTAADMARFARFLMGDGSVDGGTLIRPDLLRAMGHAHGTEAVEAGLQAGYALGLDGRDRQGVPGHCHAGNVAGWRAMFCLYPDQGKAFFLSVNADVEGANYGRLDARLIQALGLQPADPPPTAPVPEGMAGWAGFYVEAPSRFQSLAYLDRLTGFVTLSVRGDGTVALTPFQATSHTLLPVAGGRNGALLFRAEGRAAPSHVLLRTAEGDRVLSNGLRSWRRVPNAAILGAWAGAAAGVAGLLYLLVAGTVRVVRAGVACRDPLVVGWIGTVALLPPLPFLLTQDVMALGDPTIGTLLLAAGTLTLGMGLAAGLVLRLRQGAGCLAARLELAALVAALQWYATLALWGLMPLRLWV